MPFGSVNSNVHTAQDRRRAAGPPRCRTGPRADYPDSSVSGCSAPTWTAPF